MERTPSAGDAAAGVPVLKELYEQMNLETAVVSQSRG